MTYSNVILQYIVVKKNALNIYMSLATEGAKITSGIQSDFGHFLWRLLPEACDIDIDRSMTHY